MKFMSRRTFILLSRSVVLFALAVALSGLVAGCAHLPLVSHNPGPDGPATVQGQVTSDRGAVLADAGVTLTGPQVYRSVRTDVSGRFTFERVPLGTYLVTASAVGYKNGKQRITLEREAVVRADLKLKM